jgi:hypothetical protein
MSYGWRRLVRDGATATLTAFQAANPSMVDHVSSARPAGLTDRRNVFVGAINESIDLDFGTWRREAEVDVVCSMPLGDNEETVNNVDEMADALIEWLAADDRAHAFGANTTQEPVRSTSVEIQDGGTIVPAVAITCRARIEQGRT